jgi:hypothetical protein
MAPVIIAGTDEQKKRFLGRMIDEPLVCVSIHAFQLRYFLLFITFRDIVSLNLVLVQMLLG